MTCCVDFVCSFCAFCVGFPVVRHPPTIRKTCVGLIGYFKLPLGVSASVSSILSRLCSCLLAKDSLYKGSSRLLHPELDQAGIVMDGWKKSSKGTKKNIPNRV